MTYLIQTLHRIGDIIERLRSQATASVKAISKRREIAHQSVEQTEEAGVALEKIAGAELLLWKGCVSPI